MAQQLSLNNTFGKHSAEGQSLSVLSENELMAVTGGSISAGLAGVGIGTGAGFSSGAIAGAVWGVRVGGIVGAGVGALVGIGYVLATSGGGGRTLRIPATPR